MAAKQNTAMDTLRQNIKNIVNIEISQNPK